MQTMMPKIHSENYEGMQLIRPMYMVREKDIIKRKQHNDLQFIQCACRFTENCTVANTPSMTVVAVTHDRKRAFELFCISLSHLTARDELDSFVSALYTIIENS